MLKDLVYTIVSGLVEDKDKISIEMEEIENEVRVTISVADEDMGRVIGKQGRILNAIRVLARSSCKSQKKRVYVDILEKK